MMKNKKTKMNNHGICLVQGKLDENLAKRAEHYFSETKRVAKGIYMNFKYLFYLIIIIFVSSLVPNFPYSDI